jgi:hypothetical protein
MSPETADMLDLPLESMVELPGSRGAPLRGIIQLRGGLPRGVVGISPLAASILQCSDGSPLEILRLPPVRSDTA